MSFKQRLNNYSRLKTIESQVRRFEALCAIEIKYLETQSGRYLHKWSLGVKHFF